MLAIAMAVQAARLLPASIRPRLHAAYFLDRVTPVSIGVVVFLGVVMAASISVAARLADAQEEVAPEEEPFLPEPSMPPIRGRCPLVGLAALEPAAGASSLAFNLAVVVAVEGLVVARDGAVSRPRPLCLLSEGELTEALGLDPGPLERHLDRHSGLIGDELVDVTTRHLSGCELLCIPRGRVARHQLRLLGMALGRHYDLIVADATFDDDRAREAVEDVTDVLMAVSLPSLHSAEAATRMLDRFKHHPRLATTVLVINQARAETRPTELALGFGHFVALPREPFVAEADLRGVPWSLSPSSSCRRALLRFARELLPGLFEDAADAVAV